jgi:hypothetical protein
MEPNNDSVNPELCQHVYTDTGAMLYSLPPSIVYKCISCKKEKSVVFPQYKPKLYTEGDLNNLQNSFQDVLRF